MVFILPSTILNDPDHPSTDIHAEHYEINYEKSSKKYSIILTKSNSTFQHLRSDNKTKAALILAEKPSLDCEQGIGSFKYQKVSGFGQKRTTHIEECVLCRSIAGRKKSRKIEENMRMPRFSNLTFSKTKYSRIQALPRASSLP
ncbi:MAG: hypothetical protein MHMPM18_002961 [Marteilia pararefringens]